MANEDKKDFNAMLHRATDMPRIQLVTDAATVQKYGGARMYFAPAADYDAVMKRVPFGKVLTVGKIREYFARKNGADFTDPITAGIFVSISAWASAQRQTDETPYWRTLKADGELNAKYPGGAEAQRARLEAEGHIPTSRSCSHCTASAARTTGSSATPSTWRSTAPTSKRSRGWMRARV